MQVYNNHISKGAETTDYGVFYALFFCHSILYQERYICSTLFPHRMSDVHGSAIRELFKLGADPSMISFGGGNPSAETFPVPEIAEIMADVMKNAPVSVLQYGLSEGLYAAARYHEGIPCTHAGL